MNRRNFFKLIPCLACVPLIGKMFGREKKVGSKVWVGNGKYLQQTASWRDSREAYEPSVWVHDDENGYRCVTQDEFNDIFVSKDTKTSSLWKW